MLQLDTKVFVGVKTSRLGNQDLSKVGIDPPIADLVGVSQGIAGNFSSKAHMIELLVIAPEAGLDISETFAIGELSKSHAKELIQTGEGYHLVVAVVPLYAFPELVGWEELHQLSKDRSADVHSCPSPSARMRKYDLSAEIISNR